MNSHSDRITFKDALQSLQEGNPCPLLSERTVFPSTEDREFWQKKAGSVDYCINLIDNGNVSVANAELIKAQFVDDPHTRSLAIAKRLLLKLIDNSNSLSFDRFMRVSCDVHGHTMEQARESFEMTKRVFESVRKRAQQSLNEIEPLSQVAFNA